MNKIDSNNITMFTILWSRMSEQEKSHVRSKVQKEPEKKWRDAAVEILQFLNERTGRGYRPTHTNLKFIVARLQSGISTDQLRQIIVRKQKEWTGTEWEKFLRPSTLFNETKCEQYLGELG